jgi:hypothetical protein
MPSASIRSEPAYPSRATAIHEAEAIQLAFGALGLRSLVPQRRSSGLKSYNELEDALPECSTR